MEIIKYMLLGLVQGIPKFFRLVQVATLSYFRLYLD